MGGEEDGVLARVQEPLEISEQRLRVFLDGGKGCLQRQRLISRLANGPGNRAPIFKAS